MSEQSINMRKRWGENNLAMLHDTIQMAEFLMQEAMGFAQSAVAMHTGNPLPLGMPKDHPMLVNAPSAIMHCGNLAKHSIHCHTTIMHALRYVEIDRETLEMVKSLAHYIRKTNRRLDGMITAISGGVVTDVNIEDLMAGIGKGGSTCH